MSLSSQVNNSVLTPVDEATLIREKPLLEWSDALSIGVGMIDDQHKGLITILNEIHEGLKRDWGKDANDKALIKLVDETLTHFETEEVMMQVSQFYDEKDHKQQHENLIRMIEIYIKKYNADTNSSSYQLLLFLEKWLIEHILKNDKKLGVFLVNKGIL